MGRFGALARTTLCGVSGQRPTTKPAKRHAFDTIIFGAAIALGWPGDTWFIA